MLIFLPAGINAAPQSRFSASLPIPKFCVDSASVQRLRNGEFEQMMTAIICWRKEKNIKSLSFVLKTKPNNKKIGVFSRT
ncbi:hypothetical protein NC99_06740 [Sunxiuqinia dokdonensis]|uniref:Uncharacterized protein n=1 Tax=Sunxiuqinia dokdonensis TaxID=1409788 RepID=A0A0L8VDH6_9BACT|nr:hypothetical protein NC99_06740 [Sunxiuqinia dokdonensis]